ARGASPALPIRDGSRRRRRVAPERFRRRLVHPKNCPNRLFRSSPCAYARLVARRLTMRTIGSFVIAISVAASAVPVFASGVEGMEALYVGGSVPQLTAGQRGRLNTTGTDALVFEYAGG